ncbi:MAG: shikimate dehydrogenase [Elusimicrobiota bacterium]|nr:MAG: shikimate dehydrogenase [Elusimicrobiota bacterium]
MKLGLFGRPVAHSFSPRLFARLARLLESPIEYAAVDVAPGALPEALASARARGWRGANVTIPYKLDAAALCARLTPQARVLGAVNVLRFEKSRVVGHNTDGEGLVDALKRAGVSVRGKRALVFGAGGAARAAAWALAKGGARSVRVSNRTASTARKLARDLAAAFPRTAFSAGRPNQADIWINATPLGQKGRPDLSPADAAPGAPAAAVDLVYGRRTPFQRQAAALGARVQDGGAMLVYQALRAWEFWDKPLGPARRARLAETLIKEIA